MDKFDLTDFLKKTPLTVALFVVGAIFVIFGLAEKIEIAGNTLQIATDWGKIVLLVLGVTLMIFSGVLVYQQYSIAKNQTGRKRSHKPKSVISVQEHKTLPAKAENFFHTLDDKLPADTFPNMIKNCEQIDIMTRTSINLLSQYQREFEKLGKSGCKINLLFVDPDSVTSNFLYGSNTQLYRSNITGAARIIKSIQDVIGDKLEVRVTPHAPTVSIINFKKHQQKGFIQASLYFLHGAVGRDRPIFHIESQDKWYEVFENEFDEIWKKSSNWNVAKFLDN